MEIKVKARIHYEYSKDDDYPYRAWIDIGSKEKVTLEMSEVSHEDARKKLLKALTSPIPSRPSIPPPEIIDIGMEETPNEHD